MKTRSFLLWVVITFLTGVVAIHFGVAAELYVDGKIATNGDEEGGFHVNGLTQQDEISVDSNNLYIGSGCGDNNIIFRNTSSWVDRMKIFTSGEVTIASKLGVGLDLATPPGTAPSYTLQVKYSSTTTPSAYIENDGISQNSYALALKTCYTGNRRYISFINGGDGQDGFLGYNGSTLVLVSPSDERIKKNIQPVPFVGSDIIDTVRVIQFQFINDPTVNPELPPVGFSAQNLKDIYPRAVSTVYADDLGTTATHGLSDLMMVSETTLIPVLVKNLQELNEKMSQLQMAQSASVAQSAIVATTGTTAAVGTSGSQASTQRLRDALALHIARQIRRKLDTMPGIPVSLGANGEVPSEAVEEVAETIATTHTVETVEKRMNFETMRLEDVLTQSTVTENTRTGRMTKQFKRGWEVRDGTLYRQPVIGDIDIAEFVRTTDDVTFMLAVEQVSGIAGDVNAASIAIAADSTFIQQVVDIAATLSEAGGGEN